MSKKVLLTCPYCEEVIKCCLDFAVEKGQKRFVFYVVPDEPLIFSEQIKMNRQFVTCPKCQNDIKINMDMIRKQ